LFVSLRLRDGPLEKIWGGGAKYKKNSCKGKLSEKIHAQRVAQKKVLAYGKNIPAREMLTKRKKIRAARKSLPPPPKKKNLSNGTSLSINLTLCVPPKSVWERP